VQGFCFGADEAEWGCEQIRKWGISTELAERITAVRQGWLQETDRAFWIISGARTCQQQLALRAAGRPATSCELSTHVSVPATGADLFIGGLPSPAIKATFGRLVVFAGLRWGGGSPVDDIGIPSDWNHVDLGPRR
jgi:hypothetical protein